MLFTSSAGSANLDWKEAGDDDVVVELVPACSIDKDIFDGLFSYRSDSYLFKTNESNILFLTHLKPNTTHPQKTTQL
jgi:hypothetical protein